MDDKTFRELIKEGELSLILMDGGVDLTPAQLRRVKTVAKEFSDAKLQKMAMELATSPGYKEMMLLPIMSQIMGQKFQDNQQSKTSNTEQESVQTNTPEPNVEKKETVPRPEPKNTTVASTPIENLEEGDSESDILNKMFNFMKDEYNWKNEKHKKDTVYKKKLVEDEVRRSDELIGLFTTKKTKVTKKVKKETKKVKEKVEKPTVEKVPSEPSTIQKAVTTVTAAVGGAAVIGGALTLGKLIQKGESGKASYNAANMGTKNNKIVATKQKENLQDMTIGEVMARQSIKWGSPNESQKLFAVGKYQMIPGTLADAVKTLKIGKEEKFTPELQERMFNEYLISTKRPAVAKYLNSTVDDPELLKNAVRGLSREFASVADPDKSGTVSHYGSGNKASISVKEISDVLRIERENNLKMKKIPEQSLVPSLDKPQIPEKIKSETGKKSSGVSVSNVNTNVYNGATSYNVTQAEQNKNPSLIDKQYNN
jgi:hypothetical protein